MSVYVYKDGEQELICPTQLDNHLQSGWSVDDKPAKKEPEPKKKFFEAKQKDLVEDE